MSINYDVIIVADVIRLEEKRLLEEAQNAGLRVLLLNLSSKGFRIGEEKLAPYALIRSISMYRSVYSASFLEASGYRVINSSLSILLAGDKALSLPLFFKSGIPIPPTYLALSPETAISYMTSRQKPLIDKPPIGSWGRLVSIIDSDITAKIVVEHREEIPSPQMKAHLIQDYVQINGEDIRCFVVRGDVVACMKRKAPFGEWRTNVAIGAQTEPFTPTDTVTEISAKAVETIKADYGSVDIGVDKITGEHFLFEVNGVPEFKGLEKTTKANIAKTIINVVKR
jgi:lysine biosynthesis enzyme LysX